MGIFGKSFSREIGKNTGKWVSNKVFKDGHSTPYRVKIQREKLKVEQEKVKGKIAENELQIELEKQKALLNLECDISEEIIQISKLSFPKDENSIVDLLFELEMRIDAERWNDANNGKNDEKDKLTNKLSNVLLSKFTNGVKILEAMNIQNPFLEDFQNSVKKFKRIKFLTTNRNTIIGVLVFVVMIGIVIFGKLTE